MPLNIDTLDDPVILDRSPNFAGGVNSFSPPAAVAQNQLAALINCDASIEGRLVTRRGSAPVDPTVANWFANPIQGIAFFQTEAAATYQSNLVLVENGLFKIWNGATWQAPATAYAGGTTAPVMMVQGMERLWLAQSGTFLKYWGGEGAPGSIVTPASGGGTTAPVKPAIICWHTGRLIAAGIPGNPEGLSMSQYFDGTLWDHANWDISVGDGDGDPIVGLVPWTNFNLVVLKQRSIWVVNCNPALADPTTGNITGFQVTNVHRQIGCVAGRSGIQVGADVMFLSDSGVRGIARTIASEQQNAVGAPLSEPMTDFINRINPAAYGASVAYYWKNRWILAVALDAATTPSHLLVWNSLTNSWSGYWTGLTPTCFTRRVVGGKPHLCFGQVDGSVSEFLDYIDETVEVVADYQDINVAHSTGVDYATQIISRAFDCGDPDALKTGFYGRMEFNKSAATADVSVILNSEENPILAETSIPTNAGAVDLPVDLPFDLASEGILPKSIDLMQYGQWLHIQLKIATTAGKLSLNRMTVGAFMDTYPIQQ